MWLLITIAVIFLFLIYLFIIWRSKKQLKKLRRDYNEENNKSRKIGPGREELRKWARNHDTRNEGSISGNIKQERSIGEPTKFKDGGILQTTTNIVDKGDDRSNERPNKSSKRIRFRRRKK